MDKNDSTVVIHLPADKQRHFELLAERQGLNKSQYGRYLIEQAIDDAKREFDFMKSVFEK